MTSVASTTRPLSLALPSIEVNGDQAAPLYTWLKSQKRGRMGRRIEWNFAKFLIDRQGQVVKRYFATTKPERIARDIERLLGEK